MREQKGEAMNKGEIYKTNGDGLVEVIEYMNAYKVKIRFLETGNTRHSQATDIRLGRCKDRLKPSLWGVGYVGYGPCRMSSEAGKKWTAMMRRCYDQKWKQNKPSYRGATVCKEWHNLQNFAAWYEKNRPNNDEKFDLDKDLKGCGKLYSPATCSLITHSRNVRLTSSGGFKMKSPEGQVVDIDNAKNFCEKHGIDRSNLTKVIKGKYAHVKGWTYAGI